jgi:hypothetical protein
MNNFSIRNLKLQLDFWADGDIAFRRRPCCVAPKFRALKAIEVRCVGGNKSAFPVGK